MTLKQLELTGTEEKTDAAVALNVPIIEGEDMPRAQRSKRSVASIKMGKPKNGKLSIGKIALEVKQSIDVGAEGAIHLISKISPAQARALLKRIPKGQRGLRGEHVRAIAGDMRRGRFVWTGDSLRLDGKCRLIDGQHRLTAAVQSNVTLKNVIIAVVLKKANIANIDEGASRNIRDRRSILGKPVFDYSVVASVAFEGNLPDWAQHTRRGMSNEAMDDMIDAIPFMEEIQGCYQRAKHTYTRMDSSLGAVMIRCMRKNKKDARLFFTALSENSHEIDGKTVPELRAACNHMVQMSSAYREGITDGDTRRRRTQTTHRLIQAWNAWRGGDKLSSPWRYVKGTIPKVI